MSSHDLHLLNIAAQNGDADAIRRLAGDGADVNERLDDGLTLLMSVVRPDEHGDHTTATAVRRMVEVLIASGAQPSLMDHAGKRAIDHLQDNLDPDWRDVFGGALLVTRADQLVWKQIAGLLQIL